MFKIKNIGAQTQGQGIRERDLLASFPYIRLRYVQVESAFLKEANTDTDSTESTKGLKIRTHVMVP